jgi:hypothetical protein
MSSSETESTASDMSDLAYEKELGEVSVGGEVDEGPLQHCRNYLAPSQQCLSKRQ